MSIDLETCERTTCTECNCRVPVATTNDGVCETCTVLAAIPDDKNPFYLFQGTNTELLSRIVKGTLSATYLAKHELANRGFDADGKWVGFEQAAKIHGVTK